MLTHTASAVAVLGMGSLASGCGVDDPQVSSPEWLLAGFDEAAVRALGDRYLADHPQEREERRLAASVVSASRGPQLWSRARPLPEVVADEFAAGETVLVDGWVLSRTEARLCAALALRARAKTGAGAGSGAGSATTPPARLG